VCSEYCSRQRNRQPNPPAGRLFPLPSPLFFRSHLTFPPCRKRHRALQRDFHVPSATLVSFLRGFPSSGFCWVLRRDYRRDPHLVSGSPLGRTVELFSMLDRRLPLPLGRYFPVFTPTSLEKVNPPSSPPKTRQETGPPSVSNPLDSPFARLFDCQRPTE